MNDRVAQRDAAVARVMEASGLTQPIPGMADMDGQGKFFDCAPYGTCWEPMEDAAEDQEATQTPENEHYGFGKPAGHKSGFVLASFNVSGSPAQAADYRARGLLSLPTVSHSLPDDEGSNHR